MALSNAEIQRIRFELGYHVLTSSAEPYISYISVFDQIIQPYTSAGAETTSNTTVAAATTPTPVALTLASATGFSAGDRVAIDADDRLETSTVQFVSGSAITVMLTKAHTGGASTYRVTVEGGESIVREILKKIRDVKTRMATTFGAGALKRVDEIEFYNTTNNITLFGALGSELNYWREELASALGIVSMWSLRRAGGARLSVY
jgi:hypothetical protein